MIEATTYKKFNVYIQEKKINNKKKTKWRRIIYKSYLKQLKLL